jgi:hypothetical protein
MKNLEENTSFFAQEMEVLRMFMRIVLELEGRDREEMRGEKKE